MRRPGAVGEPAGEAARGAPRAAEVVAQAPAAKAAAPLAPPDPKWQALLSTSKISPSLSAGLGDDRPQEPGGHPGARRWSGRWTCPKDAPPDQRMAMLAVGGAYAPPPSMGDRIRGAAAGSGAR